MAKFFTQYWTNTTWRRERERVEAGEVLDHTAGNLFSDRGVKQGDQVYVVTVLDGELYLMGKMIVGDICSQEEAALLLGCAPEDLWKAEEHVIAAECTEIDYTRKIPHKLTQQLRFLTSTGSVGLTFKSPGVLDPQTLRGVRKLTPGSAALLDGHLGSLRQSLVRF